MAYRLKADEAFISTNGFVSRVHRLGDVPISVEIRGAGVAG